MPSTFAARAYPTSAFKPNREKPIVTLASPPCNPKRCEGLSGWLTYKYPIPNSSVLLLPDATGPFPLRTIGGGALFSMAADVTLLEATSGDCAEACAAHGRKQTKVLKMARMAKLRHQTVF